MTNRTRNTAGAKVLTMSRMCLVQQSSV